MTSERPEGKRRRPGSPRSPTWDNSGAWLSTLRHIAREGRVFVIGTNTCLRGSDISRSLPGAGEIYVGDDDWLSRGNTTVVGPDGGVLAGPLTEEAGMLLVTIDVAALVTARRQFDHVGHYAPSRRLPSVGPRRIRGCARSRPGGTRLSRHGRWRPTVDSRALTGWAQAFSSAPSRLSSRRSSSSATSS